jgi:uncharacterized alkaline shock family protein YloU
VHFTEKNGDYFEYTFTGTGIEMITEKDSSQGDIDIYVDGEFQQTISTYQSARQIGQTVYHIAGLSNGEHTLKVVKKSGYYMLLDQLKYRVSDLITPDTAQFHKNGAHSADIQTELHIDGSNLLHISQGNITLIDGKDYKVSGDKVTIKKSFLKQAPVGTNLLTFHFRGDYQNDVHATKRNNDSFEYTFQGTGIELLTAKGPDQGQIDIYVDGKFKQTVNTYHPNRQTGQSVFRLSGLTNGMHTIKGVKRSGSIMIVDQLKFMVTSPKIVNDTDHAIDYTGSWTHSTNRGFGDYQDDVHLSQSSKATLEYKFKGSSVEVIMEKSAEQGNVDIYVDHNFKQTVSTYSQDRQVQQTVYSLTGLSKGSHTIKIVKNTGDLFIFDAFKITE